jgi:hypothetical protein
MAVRIVDQAFGYFDFNRFVTDANAIYERFSVEHDWANGGHALPGCWGYATITHAPAIVANVKHNAASTAKDSTGIYRITWTNASPPGVVAIACFGGNATTTIRVQTQHFGGYTLCYVQPRKGSLTDLQAGEYLSCAVWWGRG